MALERTLVLMKPDAVMKGPAVISAIDEYYDDVELRIVRNRTLKMTEAQAREFYKEHEGKFYFEALILTMTSGPIIAEILEGEDAIAVARRVNGATNPDKAAPGTIRGDFKSGGGTWNMVHSSDSPEAVVRETAIVFSGTQ